MKARWLLVVVSVGSLLLAAADWPQWRGVNRDGKAAGFKAPATWPKELKQAWKVEVGDGAATPALVGDKLYVFSREGDDEIIRCLDAGTGKEVWQDKYAAPKGKDPAGFAGPRSSPAVAEGKVVTLGANGILSCHDTAGKKLWSKDSSRSTPRFSVASSPLIVDGLCVAQLGGDNNGQIVAYDLATGNEKWKWALEGVGTRYASPVLMTVAGTKLIVAQVSDGVVALNAADGKLVWDVETGQGGSQYKAATPIVDGDTLIYFGGTATKSVKLEKQADKFVAKDLWTNPADRVEMNTPVLKNGLLIGLSGRHDLFCFDVKAGMTTWTAPAPKMAAAPGGAPPPGGKGGKGGGFGGKGGGMGGMMRADDGYGSVVDAGSVMFALTPSSQLIVFEPTDKEFKQLASYKVADGPCYAYPVVTDNRIYIKDKNNSVTLWTVE